MTSEIAERFMHILQQIEEPGDVEPLVAMFTENAELSNLAMTEPLQGRDGTTVLEWISSGALSTGESINYRGVSLLETDNGQVHRFRTYYDSAVFLPQCAKN